MSPWRPPQLIEIVKGLGPPKKAFKKVDRGVGGRGPGRGVLAGGLGGSAPQDHGGEYLRFLKNLMKITKKYSF